MEKMKVRGLNIVCTKNNIKIIQSYQIKKKKKMQLILSEILEKTKIYESDRTIKSMIKEWRSHNKLYKLHLFRTHTEDCDFEARQSLLFKVAYFFLGM